MNKQWLRISDAPELEQKLYLLLTETGGTAAYTAKVIADAIRKGELKS